MVVIIIVFCLCVAVGFLVERLRYVKEEINRLHKRINELPIAAHYLIDHGGVIYYLDTEDVDRYIDTLTVTLTYKKIEPMAMVTDTNTGKE